MYRGKKQKKTEKQPEKESPKPVKVSRGADHGFGLGFVFKCGCYFFVLYLVYAYYTSPISPVPVEIGDRVELTGRFKPNTILYQAKRLIEGYVGPECVAFDDDDNLYTGLDDGRILKVGKDESGNVGEGKVTEIKMNKLDTGVTKERPVGLRYFNGIMYVADAYIGIYILDVKSGKRKILVDSQKLDPVPMLVDDLTIMKDGSAIYFTSTNTEFSIRNIVSELMTGKCTGTVYKYDSSNGNVEAFLTDLCCSNGIQLSKDDKTLFVGESTRYRIKMFDVATKAELKVINLATMPDNIRPSINGGVWVGAPFPRENLGDILFSSPFLRRLLMGALGEKGVDFLTGLSNSPTGVLLLSPDGEVERYICDADSTVARVSTGGIEDREGNLYLGSFKSPFLVKLMKKDFD